MRLITLSNQLISSVTKVEKSKEDITENDLILDNDHTDPGHFIMIRSLQPPYIDLDSKQLQIAELLMFVRDHSPFYRQLYQDVPQESVDLTQYPILPLDEFWQANQVSNNTVLTSPAVAGITFKTFSNIGRSYAVYSNQEWDNFTNALGKGLRWGGLRPDEQIGNLFYCSGQYSSFLFINRSLEQAKVGMCHPITTTNVTEIVDIWQQFKLTTLVGELKLLLDILSQIPDEVIATLSLEHFLYGEEKVPAKQLNTLYKHFPNCQVRSLGIADVDYGELGWVSPDNEFGVHHCFDKTTILEIVDDNNQVIDEVGCIGQLLITNLNRQLMPIIRYPVGERGIWMDPPGTPWRRFKILGKSQDGARVGTMTLYVDDMINLLAKANKTISQHSIKNFQIQVSHFDSKDCCTLRLATDQPITDISLNAQISNIIYEDQNMLVNLIQQQIVHPLNIEWITPRQLFTNPHTGQLLRIIDQRVFA